MDTLVVCVIDVDLFVFKGAGFPIPASPDPPDPGSRDPIWGGVETG